MTKCESFCRWELKAKTSGRFPIRREFKCADCGDTLIVDSDRRIEVHWRKRKQEMHLPYAAEVQTTIHELLDANQEIVESEPANPEGFRILFA